MYVIPRQVYLDHNATTPVAPEVQRAMHRALRRLHGNASSLHTPGRASRGAIEQARRSVAELLGCAPEHVIFTSGGTEGNNAVIKGVFRSRGGGHIVTSHIEHESVLGACAQVEAMGGNVTYLPAERDGRVNPEAVRDALRPDTILVSIMHANNETGAIQPVEAIAAIAREAGVPFHTDAVQTYGKLPTDVDAMGCEFLTLTAHKISGPKGVGAIYWRATCPWEALVSGGDQEQQLRAGTEGVHQIVGLGTAAALAAAGRESLWRRMEELRVEFLDGLHRIAPQARVNGPDHPHQLPGTLNITFPGMEGTALLAGLDCYEVCVSIGSACTADRIEPSHVLLGMGISVEEALSTIRISMGRNTSRKDIRYVLRILPHVLEGPPPGFAYLDPEHLDEQRVRSENTFLIDLRFPHERMLSPTIPGAVEWSHFFFERRMQQIPRDKEAILMCGTGILSMIAGYRLARSGHRSVRVVYGGYAAWQNLHREVVARLRQAPS